MALRSLSWRSLPVSLSELCLDTTLRCGQSFRWRKSEDNIWSCAIQGRILSLRQDSTTLHYSATFPSSTTSPPTPPPSSQVSIAGSDHCKIEDGEDNDTEALVIHYLNLKPNLRELYETWSLADSNFRKKAPRFHGVRILRQDAWEALVGFICSSNNNISRISQMMEKLCVHYGPYTGTLDSRAFYDMPAPSALCKPGVESHLRELGFGYRAKYLHVTAQLVMEREQGLFPLHKSSSQYRGSCWLDSLRNPDAPAFSQASSAQAPANLPRTPIKQELKQEVQDPTLSLLPTPSSNARPSIVSTTSPSISITADATASPSPFSGREGYRTAHSTLLSLQGVGPKVADCVCLMGLGWGEAVPVDTHVWQIAQRDYKLFRKAPAGAAMSKAMYDAVADAFRKLWGMEAGWAHSVLFTADLRAFASAAKQEVAVEASHTSGRKRSVPGVKPEGDEVKLEEVKAIMTARDQRAAKRRRF